MRKSLAADHNLPVLPHSIAVGYDNDDDVFHIHPVSCNEVRKVVQSFPLNKAPRGENLYESHQRRLALYFTNTDGIMNRLLQSLVFPTCWKKCEVIPLVKKRDQEVPNCNRPISLLPAASKICEHIALNQLVTYLYVNKKLTSHQSRNRQTRQSETKTTKETNLA